MTFNPSPYQQAIFDQVESGKGHLLVEAVAGSGKTTTLVEAAKHIPFAADAIFLAFNKHIAGELQRRLGSHIEARTIHSLAYRIVADCLGRFKVEDAKYGSLCKEWSLSPDGKSVWTTALIERRTEAATIMHRLIDLCRLSLIDPASNPEAFLAQCARYNVDCPPGFEAPLIALLAKGAAQAETERVLDFTDLLWLPHLWNLTAPKFDWLLCDEVQDFSPAQLALILRCTHKRTRGLWVGDRRQAIMGFAFAGFDSMDRVCEATDAIELPLSICYRCPTTHLDLARHIVPQIEPRPDAPAGTIEHAELPTILDAAIPGDLIVCRYNAPLVAAAIKLIRAKKNVKVRGRDIGGQLVRLIEGPISEGKPGLDIDGLPDAIIEWRGRRVSNLIAREAPEVEIGIVNEQAETLLQCIDGFEAPSIAALCDHMRSLFADSGTAIWLSSVHRAKGLEADRVTILQPDLLGQARANASDEQAEQEVNIKYVALTRSKGELTFERRAA